MHDTTEFATVFIEILIIDKTHVSINGESHQIATTGSTIGRVNVGSQIDDFWTLEGRKLTHHWRMPKNSGRAMIERTTVFERQ